MANITADRVLETSTTRGSGPYVLAGAVPGFRSVASVAVSSDTFYYFAEDVGANGAPSGDWEVGVGTLNNDMSISRTTIHASSNANLAVVWGSGIRRFGIGLNATHYAKLITFAEIDSYIAPVVEAAMGNQVDLAGIYQLST